MFASVDEGIGRIWSVLQKSGQLDNTFFVFTSDDGYFYGEHGLSYERRLAYEGSARIPLLIRYPALIKPGGFIDGRALTIDIAPTLFQVHGAAPRGNAPGRPRLQAPKGENH